MKRIVIVISLICSICSMSAQNTLKCVYQETYVNNANQPDNLTYDEHVLAIWGNRSAYYSRNARQHEEVKDSLLKQGRSAMEIMGVLQNIPKGRDVEIYKHQPEKGKYYCYDKNGKLFRYEDELPSIAWQMGEETKTILGYNCQKATGNLYGREWAAWFTMDIPVSDGPWLLCGLPGLVLEAYDSENIFHFTTIELDNDVSLSVEPKEKKYIKCTRKEFMGLRTKFEDDPIGMMQQILGLKSIKVTDRNGKPMTKDDYKEKRGQRNYYEKITQYEK